jgi:hypothetical protein
MRKEEYMKRKYSYVIAILGIILLMSGSVWSAEINFSGLPAGTIVNEISSGNGVSGNLDGSIQVFGYSPAFGLNTNAAIVFDSANPSGGDFDLQTPGYGPNNNVPLGNLLIIGEDLIDVSPMDGLVDDPDDADLLGMYLDFDFSTVKKNNKGTVTVNSVTMIDVEASQGEDGTYLELSGPGLPVNLIAIPPTGDNGVVVIDNIGLSGVDLLTVNLNGSGATASVIVDEGENGVCWITTGGFHNAGIKAGSKDFTFGGNVGPPPSGSWEVIDHNTGDNFHSNDVHIVDCVVIDHTGPGQPGGKKGFDINKALFEGTGRLNGVDGFPFTGFVIDGGEPAGKKGNDPDYFEIIVRDPGTAAIVFMASGNLDGGNVQIHPPNKSLQ